MTSVPEMGRDLLADLRRMGWPDPIEIWDKFASHSGARIIEENIVDVQIYSEAPELSGFDFHVVNQLKIKTELSFFRMSLRISHASMVASPAPYSAGAYLDDVEVGQFEWWANSFSGGLGYPEKNIYKDEKWYPLSDKPTSVFATLPVRTIDPAHVESFLRSADSLTSDKDETDLPTIPAPGRGRALREEMEKSNAEREAQRRRAARRPKCAPIMDSNNRVTCPCRSEPNFLWCTGSEFYNNNPSSVTTLAHRVQPGSFPPAGDGFLSWTHGYMDLPVHFSYVQYDGKVIDGRVNISERTSQLSIEISAERGESLQTAADMYRSYYTTTLDMLLLGDFIKDVQREIGSLDRMSAYEQVPFKRCPNRRHMIHEDRLMNLKVLGALECNTSPEDIILSEAWSMKFHDKCTVCAERNFKVPPEDLTF